MAEFLLCTVCRETAHYIGTTAGGRVWLAYQDEDVADVEKDFLRRVQQVGHADPLVEFNGINYNRLTFNCSGDEFLKNRIARLERWGLL